MMIEHLIEDFFLNTYMGKIIIPVISKDLSKIIIPVISKDLSISF